MTERNACRNCGIIKADGRCPSCIVTAVLMEIVKPTSENWDDFGDQLRGLRSLTHRMLNAAMIGLVSDLHNRESKKDCAGFTDLSFWREVDLHNRDTSQDIDSGQSTYKHINAELRSYSAWCAGQRQQKQEALDSSQLALLKARPGKNKEKLTADVTRFDNEVKRLASRENLASTMSMSMVACLGKTADDKFRQWLKVRIEERLPMYKKKSPIMLNNMDVRIQLIDKSSVQMSLKLRSKGTTHVIALPVSGSAWQAMRLVASGAAKHGAGKITYDEAKKKWFLRLTIIRPRPQRPPMNSDVVLAVNRGRNNFLYAISNDGRTSRVIWPGNDILQFKKSIRARTLDLKRMRHHRGSGAHGHGRDRFFASETRLKDYEINFVRTLCQRAAAALDQQAREIGAGTIVIEDFNTIDSEDLRYVMSWPWYQLKQAIAWMCEKTGRTLVEVPSEYISSECPNCGNRDVSQVNHLGIFHCKGHCTGYKNGFSRESDFVACYTMLRRSNVDMSGWDRYFKITDKISAEAAE